MTPNRPRPVSAPKRVLLQRLSLSILAVALGFGASNLLADEAADDTEEAVAQGEVADSPVSGEPFSFDILTDRMRTLAGQEPTRAERPASFLDDLAYEDYQNILFDAERARWADDDGFFQVHAFHTGWLFEEVVRIHEVVDGQSREMQFSTEDFKYMKGLAERVPEDATLPGVAGFKFNAPLNNADKFDEVVSFVGASYFRALGRDDVYGLSARGLAINTGLSRKEEFPRFSEFWLVRPEGTEQEVVVYASLESESVTGAYRFVIHPGGPTAMDVTARLFFRADVQQLGIAPLTSMYLFGENDRQGFDDFRPEVHDSDGLVLINRDGAPFWRPLNNPPRLGSTYLASPSPQAFGLEQRDRQAAHYEDPPAAYHRRPSLIVRPGEDWGDGMVRLVEIPSDLEIHDNIAAFWIPAGEISAGDEREFSYRLEWGQNPQPVDGALAQIVATHSGHGGPAGVPDKPDSRKFVVDFDGGLLGRLTRDADDDVEAVITVTNGEIESKNFSRLDEGNRWRLVIDVDAEDGATVELTAHVAGYGRKLSETWLYQWMKP